MTSRRIVPAMLPSVMSVELSYPPQWARMRWLYHQLFCHWHMLAEYAPVHHYDRHTASPTSATARPPMEIPISVPNVTFLVTIITHTLNGCLLYVSWSSHGCYSSLFYYCWCHQLLSTLLMYHNHERLHGSHTRLLLSELLANLIKLRVKSI
jgi:hypothetical protein